MSWCRLLGAMSSHPGWRTRAVGSFTSTTARCKAGSLRIPVHKRSYRTSTVLFQNPAADHNKVSLVIFDKDGTLVDFDSMWTPWLYQFADRLKVNPGYDSTALRKGDVLPLALQKQLNIGKTLPQQFFCRSFSTQSHIMRGNVVSKRMFSSSAVLAAAEKMPSHDYVIVGAGSAGCILANRMTADEGNSVFLLEAGPVDNSWRDWWKIQMPAALMYTLFDPRINWCYYSVPQKHVDNRKMYQPRGKLLGGCASHNAMVYVRAHAYDYDRWEKEGAEGWSYANCLPYFKRSQTHEYGEDEYRGGSGPLKVSRGVMIDKNPLHNTFIEAGLQAGYPFTDDMNGYQQEGFGYFDRTIWKGVRSGHASNYLHPVMSRKNLSTECNAFVTRILFEGNRAVGIEYKHRGQLKQVRARKEVIVSGGAINSPHLLMVSGVGNADHLQEFDIPVVQHLPGVGQNLQDHLELYVQYECKQPITLYKHQWKFPLTMIKTGLQWFLFHSGNASTCHLEAGAFIRSRPGIKHPDIQYHFLPSVVINHGSGMGDCHAYQSHVGPMRATSRGQITLQSKSPEVYPLIDFNYLSTENDRQEFRDCVRLTREIMTQKAFDPYRGREIQPGIDAQSDSQIDAFVRAATDSAYHPSCTCKMGSSSDPMTVVDPSCRVLGLEGLRVVDASIMPSNVSGNLNAPVTMLAERAADIILGKELLPSLNVPVWEPKSLDTQR